MSFNELNSVEHYIIQKLSGVNLNQQKNVKELPAKPFGNFPWKFVPGEQLARSSEDIIDVKRYKYERE
jgi:type I restriction enzyme R subunit